MTNHKGKISRETGGIVLWILILVVLGSIMLVGGSFSFNNSIPQNSGQPVNVTDSQPPESHDALQIRGLNATTPSPSPTPTTDCGHDSCQPTTIACSCQEYKIQCQSGSCINVYPSGILPNGGTCTMLFSQWCSNLCKGDAIYCLGKPVIYLYPTKDTLVNVKLNTPGKIVESIPTYPSGGWHNILAHPNGTLEYNRNTYSELYYESSVTNVTPPKDGFVVETKDIKQTLISITNKLGLIPNEQEELVNYWLPRVDALNSQYVFISVIDNSEKQKIDRVSISPKPDTMIDFLLYFKPENKPVKVTPLNLPQNPPQRIGFTAVEWGGTIDNN